MPALCCTNVHPMFELPVHQSHATGDGKTEIGEPTTRTWYVVVADRAIPGGYGTCLLYAGI